MKILHVINVRWFNATAWYALTLAKLQKQHGHDVSIITIKDTDTDKKAKALGFSPLYINLTTSNPIIRMYSLYKLCFLIRTLRPDIVNCHRGESFVLFSLLSRVNRFALVRTRGDQRAPKKNWINTLLHKYCADAIIATNTRMTSTLESSFNLEKNSVDTIFGGVDTQVFRYSHRGRKRIRSLYNIKEDEYLLGVLGRLDWIKGQKEIIQAVTKVVREYNVKVKLLLIGFTAGITQETVENWIKEHGMQDIIYVTGKCDSVIDYLSALDIAILCSLGSETIARAALEIMSCDIPLLSTNVGVMPDLLPSDLLIHLPQDKSSIVETFADAIVDCIENAQKRQKLLEIQRKNMSFLSEEYFYEITQCVYMKAIENKKKKR